jgi:tyrosine-protein phosphatase SIW14
MRIVLLLLCFILSERCVLGEEVVAPPSAGDTVKTERVLLTPRDDIPGVKNFAKVSEVLFRGEQPTAEGFAELKKMGVKTIVNLRSFHSDRDELTGTGLQYVHLYCKAWHAEDEDVARFLKLLKDPKNLPVFVHCQHGADRTGMMVASYRIVEQGWNPDDAARETHNFGFHKIFSEIQNYLKHFNATEMIKTVDGTAAPKIEVVK